jgi:AraC family transcriptional regulator
VTTIGAVPSYDARTEYDARLHRVLEHIDRHLDRSLDLETLAGVAHFSPFHFHRVFLAWMGETLGEYLRRRRLETAAMRLLSQPRLSVLQLSQAVGFGSPEAFARAFKLRFGVSPTAWRVAQQRIRAERTAHRNLDQANRNLSQAPPTMFPQRVRTTLHKESPMPVAQFPVSVVTRQPVHVAYLRLTGPYGPAISAFWMHTVAPWMTQHGLWGATRFGVSLDDPQITAPDQCRYDACVEVPTDFVPTGGALLTTLPGGRYAVLTYDGPLASIGTAWDSIMRDWLPQSGMQLDGRPMFERYPVDGRYDPVTGMIQCEICIPVAPL